MAVSIHDFSLKAIDGSKFNFADFKGKKILLVNVASFCGLTPQYTQLQEIYAHWGDKLTIVGVPANNFANQEPNSESEIQQFCSVKYEVSFPLTQKISVKGDDQHELYQFVTQKAKNGVLDSEVTWNFQKYIFDENGFLTHTFSPRTEPADEEILKALGVA
jgi:glutathione peroxidase